MTKLVLGFATLSAMLGVLAYFEMTGLNSMAASLEQWDAGLRTIRDVKDTAIFIRDAGQNMREAILSDDMNEVKTEGAPSYTSGVQK